MRRSAWIVIVVLVGCSSASAAPRRVIPWLDAHAAKASGHPPLAAPCRARDLRAHLFLQGATGSLVGGVDLTDAGAGACSLVGWPTLTFTGRAASVERWKVKRLAASPSPPEAIADPPGSLRALRPGRTASVSIFWSNWCDPRSPTALSVSRPPAAIVLGLRSGTRVSVPVAHAPRCDAPPAPSTVDVGPFTPATRHLPASSRLALRAVIEGTRTVPVKPGLRAFRVHRGERFHYVVSLTNTGAKPFRFARTSCPSYIQQVALAPAQVYVLNCRPVGAIAPGATVEFAMEVVIPQRARIGNNSLTWELAPRTYDPPFTPAALWVVPASAAGPHGAAPAVAFRWIQMLDRSRGYALSGEDANAYRLLWTRDGGHTWADVTPGNGRIHPSGPLSVFGQVRLFSTELRRGVYAVERSDDGGRTWRRSLPFRDPHGQGAGQPFAIDTRHLFLAVDEGAAAGSQGEALFTSSDGGRRWRLISATSLNSTAPGRLPFGCDKNGFGFSTPARGWAGGYCAGGWPFFYRTDDGGRSWRRQPLPVSSQCACETSAPHFFTPTLGAVSVIGFTTNGGGRPFARMLWTSDGGEHWRGSDPPVGRASQAVFVNAATVWVVGQRKGRLSAPFTFLVRTVDAGRHWLRAALPFDGQDYRFDALSTTSAYGFEAAASSSALVVTHDGGRTWEHIDATLTR